MTNHFQNFAVPEKMTGLHVLWAEERSCPRQNLFSSHENLACCLSSREQKLPGLKKNVLESGKISVFTCIENYLFPATVYLYIFRDFQHSVVRQKK